MYLLDIKRTTTIGMDTEPAFHGHNLMNELRFIDKQKYWITNGEREEEFERSRGRKMKHQPASQHPLVKKRDTHKTGPRKRKKSEASAQSRCFQDMTCHRLAWQFMSLREYKAHAFDRGIIISQNQSKKIKSQEERKVGRLFHKRGMLNRQRHTDRQKKTFTG